MNDTVSTARQSTRIAATVTVHLVAIVTILDAEADQAVATAGFEAAGDAGIVVGCVAVITGFEAGLAFGEVAADHTVATARIAAGAQTDVVLIAVAIVAFLIVRCLRVVALAGDPIAALGQFAAVGAIVGGDLIAVIAFLIHLQLTIAAFAGHIAHDHLLTRTAHDAQRDQ